MARSIYVERATLKHVEQMAPRVLADDREEIAASHNMEPLAALRFSVEASVVARVALYKGRPAAMFGVAPTSVEEVGSVWMFGTPDVLQHPIPFARVFIAQLLEFSTRWPNLMNAIDVRHYRALRWAEWLGFEIQPPTAFGYRGMLFHPVWYRRKSCAYPS